jgi:hypothetical protein
MTDFGIFRGAFRRPKLKVLVGLWTVSAGLLLSGCLGVVKSAPSGAVSLTISSVSATSLTTTGATISWQTNAAASSQVEYGTSATYGSVAPVNAAMVTSHSATLTALKSSTLYHYRVTSVDANNNSAVSGDFTFTTTNGGDTVPPTVSVTAPLQNATISGTVAVTAAATDNVAVATVQFQLDGANLGATVIATPYAFSWDTTKAANGVHTLRALVVDTSNNSATSTTVSVTVNNTTPQAPSVGGLTPNSGIVGSSVTITGTNFGATQGASTVKFNGVAATPTSWSATSIVAAVPNSATTGNVVVTVGGLASNGVSFAVTASGPTISSLSPTSGLVGTAVTIAGTNFGATQGASTVKFNGVSSTPTSWSGTSIVAAVPSGASSGNVIVTVAGLSSNGVSFTVSTPAPSIVGVSPTSGFAGTPITITGANFGATQGASTVKFNGVTATPSSWSTASIVAPVPNTATTGNVVVTVGANASNGVPFTLTLDTTPPVVTISGPASGATVSGTTTFTATATDPDSPVSFVQFLVDGANAGGQLTSSPYSLSFDTTTLSNATHVITALAKDPAGNQGSTAGVTVTVANVVNTSMGPLKQSTVNTRYFVNPAGNAIFLAGSHTWDNFQDTDTSGSTPATFDFTGFVTFMKQHGQNATILWRKDLPQYCNWNVSGSVWNMGPWPWLRPGPGVATDSGPKFDLTQLNQAYFDRLRSRVQQLQQNGMYAIVELFDANQLTFSRCSTDGYPFTGTNNINGVDDGYTSGASGMSSVTMSGANAVSGYQDTYLKKVMDTLNDLPNVIYEVSEEQPAGSATWWFPHVISFVRSYEATKPLQHPVGIGSMNATAPNDGTLYASTADWIAPTINSNFSNQFPSNVATNNQGKVVINDADHAYYWKTFTNSDGSLNNTQMRNYLWENISSGAEGVVLMDPYVVYWPSAPNRNLCLSPLHQICTGGVDTKFDSFRSAMGAAQSFVNSHLNLLKMTPQGGLSSTGFCLADNSATGAEYLVYAPSGGTFTVNLSASTRAMNVLWLNPGTGATTAAAGISGGSTQSFTAPFSGDAVLYIVDAAGHN